MTKAASVQRPLTHRQKEEVQRYLAGGGQDLLHSAWPGGIVEGSREAKEAHLGALLAEIDHRAGRTRPTRVPAGLDLQRFTRSRVEPMVRGLFPGAEQEAVLSVVERSIVFVTRDHLEAILGGCSYLTTAWDIANLYLASVGADLLGGEPMTIVGLSEETTCYVSPRYFDPDANRFADFVLHEAAHIFHNCKRRTVGLPPRGKREWLLDIDFRMRETFAYACEAYGRILELGTRPVDRRRLLAEHLAGPMPGDDRVDEEEYRSVVAEAVGARNGWNRILRRCAPRPPRGLPDGNLVFSGRGPLEPPDFEPKRK